jgi:hypothetical protein
MDGEAHFSAPVRYPTVGDMSGAMEEFKRQGYF